MRSPGMVLAEPRSAAQAGYPVGLTITHRFTPGSKTVLEGWYPGSDLPMQETERSRKLTRFGSAKYVLPRDLMQIMHILITDELECNLLQARMLYWT